jgi:hypothetical protein
MALVKLQKITVFNDIAEMLPNEKRMVKKTLREKSSYR